MAKRATYTAAEDEIIMDVYPKGGRGAVHALLPHRNPDAISKRANKLGVHSSNSAYSRPRYRAPVLTGAWGLPVHEYTYPDLAVRDWARNVEPGQPAWRVA